jgi:hypothetical protein
MKSIDKEIFEVETRLHMREARIKQAAREARVRAVKGLKSPAAIAGSAVLGFVVASFLGRRKAKRAAPAVSEDTKEQTKGFAVGGLLMTALTWFIKHQFGGPVGLAQFVVSKIRSRNQPGSAPPAVYP